MKQSSVGGFALVELIICIGLIALLTAVAIPQFMEAQTSSSVARAQKDLHHISIALETYRLDIGKFPRMNGAHSALRPEQASGNAPTLERLTTPVAYLSGAPFFDPFEPDSIYTSSTLEQILTPVSFEKHPPVKQYFYTARNFTSSSVWYQTGSGEDNILWFLLESSGPDKHHHYLYPVLNSMTTDTLETRGFLGKTIYDPTNGTTSRGSIWRVGGNPSGNGKSMAVMVQSAKANEER